MKAKYIYRHRTLKYLYDKIKNEPLHHTDLRKSWSNFNDIATHLKIDAKTLKEYHEGFHFVDKEHVACKSSNGHFLIGIEEAGVAAYLDDYWLREGEKELNERIYDKVKWMIPIAALLITAFSLAFTVYTIQRTRNKVELIESRLNTLEQQKKPENLSGKPYGQLHP